MRLAIQLDHKYGSKWLLDEMHSFGHCESYHEVKNYKYCVLRSKMNVDKQPSGSLCTIAEEADDALVVDSHLHVPDDTQHQGTPDVEGLPNSESHVDAVNTETDGFNRKQFVGDNIDINVVSINGNTPFHAMGWIKVGPRKTNNDELNYQVPRCRLSPTEKAKVLKAGDIPIKHCPDPKKSGIESMVFQPLEKLTENFSSIPARPDPLDGVWSAGWIMKKKDERVSHSNWNGWMKNVHCSDNKEVNDIEYMPIIDGDPNDHSTIYTLLQKSLEMEPNPVVTFDLPIWLKSVDIIKSKKLSIIPRLGGFHLLKSFLGTFDSIFADSGLHELVQLIYPGPTVADSILNGGSYDKAIRSHFLIDAAIVQHVIPQDMFSDQELSEMEKIIADLVENKRGSDFKNIPIASSFQKKIDEAFNELKKVGRTAALWALYHDMVDTIKVFIRAERTGNFSLHLSCIANRMLNIFAAAGHHHYAKAARLYVQMMLAYEKGSVEESAILKSFKLHGSHVIRYSSFEWSGIWSDLCIEQTLMRYSKSDGGLTGGRFRNGDSAHKCWVQTLSHVSLINRMSQKDETKKTIHRDLAPTQRAADAKAIVLVGNWLNDMQPFDKARDKDLLISFSTGFFSRRGDEVNPENAVEVGRAIQTKLDDQIPTAKIETKTKVKPLSSLRNSGNTRGTTQVNALKYFNRLVIFAQRVSNLEKSLEYELTPFPLSLFSEKDQLMHDANKAAFAQECLKDRVEVLDSPTMKNKSYVIDGGWLLRQTSWGKSDTWKTIIERYVDLVQYLGSSSEAVSVIFDGYESSTKDHTHRRRMKHFCHDMQINLENIPYTTKEKFLSNANNKTELITLITNKLRENGVHVTECRDDADTAIVKSILEFSKINPVEVRAEDSDIMIMLVYHYNFLLDGQI